jgi:hypothetical protein
MRPATFIAATLLFAASQASGGAHSVASAGIGTRENEVPEWSFSASLSGYAVPDDKDYLAPLLTADRDWLHLEARHNYEALDTASLWVGWNFSCGEKWVFDFTPMVGGIFGHTKGLAPGWRLGLSRGALEFTSEAEFVFDAEDSSEDFFYAWSELTWSFTERFWVGLALQRTRAYETDLDVQRGVLVGCSVRDVELTAYVFNWGWDDPLLVFSIGVSF